eukprot:6207963-Pleurochrysis_carterae.AAC.1
MDRRRRVSQTRDIRQSKRSDSHRMQLKPKCIADAVMAYSRVAVSSPRPTRNRARSCQIV